MDLNHQTSLWFYLSVLAFCVLTACQPEESVVPNETTGTVVFSVPISGNAENGRIAELLDENLSQVIVTIESNSSEDTSTIYKELNLFNFEGTWITEPIALKSSEYRVTQFLVSNDNQEIIYAAPTVGSNYANLVEKPLAIDFNVQSDETTQVAVEVVSTIGSEPEDFGYATFTFEIASTFDFLLSVFSYNSTTKNFELTTAHLTVLAEGDTLANYELEAVTNSIKVLDGYDRYEITLEKDGYVMYQKIYSNKTLKSYNNRENGPIIVKLESAVDLTEDLQAHYPFTGNANDASPRMYHGTVTGATLTTDKLNNANNAYLFDGIDDRIDVGQVDLEITNNVTVSAWVKTSSTENGHCVGKYNWRDDKGFVLSVTDGYARLGGRDGNNTFIAAISENKVNDGEWHHLVGIVQDSVWQIWVDGDLATSVNTEHTNVDINTNDPLAIGYFFQGTGEGDQRHFDGSIDNIRIYNRPITTTEIKYLYEKYQ